MLIAVLNTTAWKYRTDFHENLIWAALHLEFLYGILLKVVTTQL